MSHHLSNIDTGLNKITTDVTLLSGTESGTGLSSAIDLGVGKDKYNSIQISGQTSSSGFEFIILYSYDGTNYYGSDNIKPDVTQHTGESVYRFSLTRTAICHRYIKINYIVTGLAVHLGYSLARL